MMTTSGNMSHVRILYESVKQKENMSFLYLTHGFFSLLLVSPSPSLHNILPLHMIIDLIPADSM
jgi:hypothetical protein